ncbi:MAG: histidine kinase [Firmicutes bacterium]|nr:histidine kinase [Bacillota bacterium]MCM1401454.1 histidine kinase [Bacteroides sp.]MCM1476812.1 histidine kinase [Bacteroides sp.]
MSKLLSNILKSKLQFNSRKLTFVSIHIVALLLLFIVPVAFMTLSSEKNNPMVIDIYAKALIWVATFYASYYLITDPTTGKTHAIAKFAFQILLTAAIAVAAQYVVHVLCHLMGHGPGPHHMGPHHQPPPRGVRYVPVMQNILVTLLTIGLGQAIKFMYRSYRSEQQRREIQARERETELKMLKAQLKPHFLFNSLNTIYALIDINPEKAKVATHSLSKLLRYTLNDILTPVTLSEEVRFLNNYIDLMKLRMSAAFPVSVLIDVGECENVQVAPMLFLNIVENAFKHGLNAATPGKIEISITANDNKVRCITRNPFGGASGSPGESNGIGISNLRRRLSLLYPNRHSLTMGAAGNFYVVDLMIDISTGPTMTLESLNPTNNL